MKYSEWSELFGQYRWYHEDGSARALLPLDYEWQRIYDNITRDTDIHFHLWEIPCDVEYFTSQFYSAVPTAWLKFKSTVELFLGTLDGTTIDPLMFEAGYTRTTDHTLTNDNQYNDNEKVSSSATGQSTQSAYEDTANILQRGIMYNQGVQAIDFNNQNIGQLGNKYASTLNDNIGQTDNQYGQQKIDSNTNDNGQRTRANSEDKTQNFHEKVHETRINYYDNLAFLRDRVDRLKLLMPFHKSFEQFFTLEIAMTGDW